jgi:TP901 family phage tail tape measure protein
MESRLKKTGRVIGGIGDSLVAMAAAAAASGLFEMGKQTIAFDKGMRNVNSIAQLSEGRLAKLGQQVLKLGGKTAQQPETLAAGLYDLVSSGFDAHDSLKILASSARAATAGLTTTEVSTGAVAAVLNAYHLPASKAKLVSDQLFRTVDRGVISFEDLASNVGDVLPFASSLGIGLDQVGASIATMTKAGISAPETMTRIKAVMTTMLKPGVALSKTLKQQGYESGEALIKAKGFQGSLDLLAKTTGGSKEQMAKLFPNVRALGGALALTGKNSKVAQKDVKGMASAGGATSRALSQQSKSVSYQWNQLKAQASAMAIQWGSTLIPFALKLLRAIMPLARQAVPYLVKAFNVAKGVFGQVMTAIAPAKPFFDNVLGPLLKGFAIGVIGAVVAAFKTLIAIAGPLFKALGWIGTKAAPLKGFFQGLGTVIGFVVAGPVMRILGTLGKLGFVFRLLGAPIRILEGGFKAVAAAGSILFRGMGLVVSGVVKAFTWYRRYVGFMAGLPGRLGRIAVNIAASVINGIERLISGGSRVFTRFVSAASSVLRRAPGRLLDAARKIGSTIINGIADAIRGAPQALASAIGWVVDQLPIPGVVKGKVKGMLGLHAKGGVVRTPLQVVGEHGPELAALPIGSRVLSAPETRQAAAARTRPASQPMRPIELVVRLGSGAGREIHREVFKVEQRLLATT